MPNNFSSDFGTRNMLAPPNFSSMNRIVIDTEGPVLKLTSLRAVLPGNVLSFRIVPLGSTSKTGLAGHSSLGGDLLRPRTRKNRGRAK
jgi:hypothetical protein